MKSHSKSPFIIPVFLPNIGCPHRCIFCDQTAITGENDPPISTDQFHKTVLRYLAYRDSRGRRTQISFYGGNFLGLQPPLIHSLLKEAACFVQKGDVDSLRFSTRPDTISREQLDMLRHYPVETIELGVQSMNNRILQLIHRDHSAEDTEKAVFLLHQRGYEIGLQMMVGLPGDDHESAVDTARKILTLSPDFVRIYPTIVLANSPLAAWYKKGIYTPPSLASCVTLVKQLYELFHHHHIPVVRMGLQASEELNNSANILAGPYHPAFGHLVLSEFLLDKAISALNAIPDHSRSICISVHPRSISRLRGFKNRNIKILKDRFSITSLKVTSDSAMEINDLIVSAL